GPGARARRPPGGRARARHPPAGAGAGAHPAAGRPPGDRPGATLPSGVRAARRRREAGAVRAHTPLELSVVIPAYNEEARIRATLDAVVRYLTESRIAHEILVVDDGSTDGTATVVSAVAAALPSVRVLPGAHR